MDKYLNILGLNYLFRKWVLFFFVFLPLFSFGQILEVEYYIDTDPGYGNGTAIELGETPDPDDITINTTIDLSGISNGFHVLYVRAKGKSSFFQAAPHPEAEPPELEYTEITHEAWSIITAKPFLVASTSVTDNRPDISRIEYFIDTDPGLGKGTAVSGFPTSGSDISHSFIVDLNDVSNGLHILYVRTQDVNGQWSVVQSKPILVVGTSPSDDAPNIAQAEYFIDTDPGLGNGIKVEGLASGADISQSFNVDLNDISGGLHILYLRTQDVNGQWSVLQSRPILVTGTSPSDPKPDIVELEYFIDTDPGLGNGKSTGEFEQSSDVSHSFIVDLNDVSSGLHIVYFRAKDANGQWSVLNSKPILVVANSPTDPSPKITEAEYFIDTDPGIGLGNPIEGSFGASDVSISYTIDLSNVSDGLHILYMRAKDASGQWSVLNSKPILVVGNSPTDPAPNISKFEYFIDTDPGLGNGTVFTGFSSNDVSQVITVDLNGVSNGLHILYTRAQDVNGQWSVPNAKPILVVGNSPTDPAPFLTEFEYFFDTDPGFGNGKRINDFSPNDQVSYTLDIDLSDVSSGLHLLYLRAKDQNEQWSVLQSKPVLVFEGSPRDPGPNITRIEYFFINETIEYTSEIFTINIEEPGSDIEANFIADISQLVAGETYQMKVYGVNANGKRSLWHTSEFEVVIPPLVISPMGDLTLDEDFTAFTIEQIDTIFTDPQDDILTYSIDETPNELLEVSITDSTLFINPKEDANGQDTLFIIATDPSMSQVTDTVIVTINAINDEPEFDAIADTTINEDAATVNITIEDIETGGEDDESEQTLSFDVESDNEALIPTPIITYEGEGSTAQLSFTPSPDLSGTAIISVTLNDSGRGNAPNDSTYTQTFTVTVNPINDEPVMTVEVEGTIFIEEDSGERTVNISGIADSPLGNEGQNLSIVATSDNPTIIADPVVNYTSNESNGTLTFTPEPDEFGFVTITVTLNDDGSGISPNDSTLSVQFSVEVLPIDDDPTIDEVSDMVILEDDPTQNITLTGITSGAANENQTIYIEAFSSDTFLIKHPTITYNSPENTATLTYIPESNQFGKDTITVNVLTEGEGEGEFLTDVSSDAEISGIEIIIPGITTISFVVEVDTVNDAPAFARGLDQSHLEDEGAISVTEWAEDISVGPLNENDQNILTFNVSNDNNSLFAVQPAIDVSGNLSYTLEADANGTANVTVSVTDDGGTENGGIDTSAEQTFVISVTSINDAPSFTMGENQSVFEDTGNQNITGWATEISKGPDDENGQILNFEVTNDNNTLFSTQPAVSASGDLTFTLGDNAVGDATISIILRDDGGLENGGVDSTVVQTFTISVNQVNDSPGFTKGADQTVLEDAGAQTVSSWATDIIVGPSNESEQSITAFNVSNDNTDLFSVQPAIDVSGNLTFTPAEHMNGSATVTVTVTDDGGTENSGVDTSGEQTFIINVTPVNDAPSFTIGSDQSILEDAGPQNVSSWATDILKGPLNEESQNLSFEIANDNNSLFATQPAVDNSGTLTYTTADDAVGSAIVSIILRDDGGLENGGVDSTEVQTFIITVNQVNDSPGFTAGADQVVLEDAGAQTVVAWATNIITGPDNESDQLITSFNVSNNNNDLFLVQPAIDVSGNLTYTPADNANGTAIITVSITDDGGIENGGVNTSADQTFEISVTPVNDAPSFTLGANQSILEDVGAQNVASWALDISEGPEDESAQNYSFILTNDNNDLFSSQPAVDVSGNLTFTPADDAVGDAIISIILRDDGGLENGGIDSTEVQTFTITVNQVNDSPSFVKGDDQVVLEDAEAQTITDWATNILTGPDNESDQIITAFNVSNNNTDLFSVQPSVDISGNLTFTPVDNANGVATVTISVTDNGGTENSGVDTSADQNFTITVTAVNDAPSFTIGEDQSVFEDAGPQTISTWATDISPGPANEISQTSGFILTNDNTTLFASQPVVDALGTLSYTPADDANGLAIVSIILRDDGGLDNGGVDSTVVQTFNIEVVSINDIPSFTKGSDQSVLEESGLQTVNGWATDILPGPSNESDQELIFNISTLNENLFDILPAVNPVTGDLSYTLAEHANGVANININISDNGGTENGGEDTSADQIFTITVNSVNDAPSFVKGDDLAPLEDSGPLTFEGWATTISTGPENEDSQSIVSFNVNNDNNDLFSAQPEIDIDGNLSFTLTDDVNGEATVTVTLTDDGGTENGGVDTSTDQTFLITVVPVNDDPTDIALSNNMMDDQPLIGALVGNLSVSDIDIGDAHSYSLNNNFSYPDNDFFTIDDDELKVDGVLSFIVQQSYLLNIQVQDAAGATFDKEFTITLNEPDVTEADSTSLIDLFDELGDLLPWDLDDPVYTWEGVELAGDSTVRSLDLSFRQITELNSDLISGLDGLEFLDVSNNRLRFDNIEALLLSVEGTEINFIYSPQERIDEQETVHEIKDQIVNMSVTSTSANNLFQWTHNEEIIEGETSQTLEVITSFDLDDDTVSGRYSCRITNSLAPELTLVRENVILKVVSAMNTADSTALASIYSSMNLDESLWVNSAVSLASGWPGVITRGDRIVELDLTSLGLSGFIPPEIGDLTALTKLVLFDNNIGGTIPSEIGNLINLEILDLDKNSLSGAVPAQLGNLVNLTTLWLARNRLTSIPDEIGNLEKLRNLFLHRNLLTAIPATINNDNLPELELFNISNNLISEIPANGITTLMKLKEFNIGNNNIESLPSGFDAMSALEFFGVRRNRLDFGDLEVFDLSFLNDVVEYIPQNELTPDVDDIVLLGETYSIISEVGGSNNVYIWRKDGDVISNTSSSYVINEMSTDDVGVYSYEVTDEAHVPGLTIISQKFTLGADCGELLEAQISTDDPTLVCAGTGVAITFNASPVDEGNSYKWLKDGVNIAAINSETFTAYETGFFQVEITDAEGCTDLSEGIQISETDPIAVNISEQDTVLVATSDIEGAYQWFLNEQAIDEATDSTWLPLSPGDYYVAFSNDLGCITYSDTLTVTVTGLLENGLSKAIGIYPNPNKGLFSLSIEDVSIRGSVKINIRNALGKIVEQKLYPAIEKTIEIDIRDQPSGMYMIEIFTQKGLAVKRLVKK